MAPQPPVAFTPGTSSQLPAIFISESQTEQTIEGFGASMTDSAAYLLNEKVPPAALPGVMQSLFSHSQGIGVSFLRNPMGASDLTRPPDYSYDDLPFGATDPNLTSFSIAHDQADILPMLVQAKAINVEGRDAVAVELDVPLSGLKPGPYLCQLNVIDDAQGSFAFPRFAVLVKAPLAAPAPAVAPR